MNHYKVNYKLIDTETLEYSVHSLTWILNEINRDRSDEWTDYTKEDFIEGLHEWTNYKLVGIANDT